MAYLPVAAMSMWVVLFAAQGGRPMKESGFSLTGRFAGAGTWHDAQGKRMNYVIAHDAKETPSGFDIEFTHDFEDRTQVHAHLEMSWLTPQLFSVRMGSDTVGHGYCLEGVCKYHLKAGDRFVEVGYHPTATGLDVFGSSSTNVDGNYIAWHEHLERR